MAQEQEPLIRVLGFKTTFEELPVLGDPAKDTVDRLGYKLNAKGERIKTLQEELWVTYAPSHSPINTQMTERVRVLIPDPKRMGDDQDGEKLRFMTARWRQIEPAWTAFKEGREVPLNGTPLAAWPGVSPEQAEVFRQFAIRTVEEVAGLMENQIEKIRLPGVRELRKEAKLFLENNDAAKAAKREAQKDTLIAEMAERMAAMEQLLEERTAPKSKVKEAA